MSSSSIPSSPRSGTDAVPAGGGETSTALRRGLESGHRFRCDACGNVTRFDVVMTVTTRRFHHFDLGGEGRIDEEEVLDQQLGSVTCRWCGRGDAIRVEAAPAAAADR